MNIELQKIVENWIAEHKSDKYESPVGIGNTRYVFRLSPGYIIKECNYDYSDDDGIYCNIVEYNLYQNATDDEKVFLNPTIGIYNDGKYVVAKECYPVDCYILDVLNRDIDELETSFQDIGDFIKEYPQYELDLNKFSEFCKKNDIFEAEARATVN